MTAPSSKGQGFSTLLFLVRAMTGKRAVLFVFSTTLILLPKFFADCYLEKHGTALEPTSQDPAFISPNMLMSCTVRHRSCRTL